MSQTTTRAPSRASPSAIARPMPRPPPVTMATLPETMPGICSVLPSLTVTAERAASAIKRVSDALWRCESDPVNTGLFTHVLRLLGSPLSRGRRGELRSASPNLVRQAPRSCAASPTAPPRPGYCPPRSRRSRIAATGRAGRCRRYFAASSMRRLSSSRLSSCAALGGDEAEHDGLALRHEAQRLEAAGALGVVLHEIAVDLDGVEQDLGDRLVAARAPRRSSGNCRGTDAS